MAKLLSIYLGDQLVVATVAAELAARTERSNRDTPYGAALATLRDELAEDRRSLERIMEGLDVTVDRTKVAMGWCAEKLGRLKLNGRLRGYSPLSRLVEFDGLTLCVQQKLLLLQALADALDGDERLVTLDLGAWRDRAARQMRTLDDLRRAAAPAALRSD